jgi:hypothetical protein
MALLLTIAAAQQRSAATPLAHERANARGPAKTTIRFGTLGGLSE